MSGSNVNQMSSTLIDARRTMIGQAGARRARKIANSRPQDRRLRVLLRDFLAENGFLVATADDAADARGKLSHLDFDAIVLDVREDQISRLRDITDQGLHVKRMQQRFPVKVENFCQGV